MAKRGRPRKEIPYIDVSGGSQARPILLDEIDLEDETFKFRVALRLGSLTESIKENGQQFPVLLRRKQDGRLQIISGFRRISAIRRLGWDRVNGIVRDDLADDTEACKVSIIENEARQTYNDLDRAYAILAYRRMGKSNAEIEEIFKVGSRQRQRLEKLVDFPATLQREVADGRVSSTNAVRLMQHVAKHPDTDVDAWIERIINEQLTYKGLGAALREAVAEEKEGGQIELYVERETKGGRSLRLRPISIDGSITAEQKQALVKDIQAMLKFVKGL